MRRVPFFVGRVLLATVAGLLLLAGPARADVFTIHFQGEADLTSEGGGVYAYSGFITWDSSALPHSVDPEGDSYALLDYSLIFDGTDVTFAPSPDGNGNGLFVGNNTDILGFTGDVFAFYAGVGRPFDPTGDLFLFGMFPGPVDMFDSTALPSNVDFLQVASPVALFFFEPDEGGEEEGETLEPRGTLLITRTEVVPEPATLALTAFGLSAALARMRRRRSKI